MALIARVTEDPNAILPYLVTVTRNRKEPRGEERDAEPGSPLFLQAKATDWLSAACSSLATEEEPEGDE